VIIKRATIDDISQVAPLFDQYRQFYQCDADLRAATDYLTKRLERDESIIFLASTESGKPLGFTQLYPTFCSVELIRILVLYDLYVDEQARSLGVGSALLVRARQQAVDSGAGRLDLQTAQDNLGAQKLYARFGFRQDREFQNWSYHIKPGSG